MRSLRYCIVDAFATRPFSGNPAAVVLLDDWPDSGWLQNVAMEMNLSETAFVVPQDRLYGLRWFTPKVEVDLCGHATLAAAKALADMGRLADGSAVDFMTRSGILRAVRRGDQYELDFPVKVEQPTELPPNLIESLHVEAQYTGRNEFDYLVAVESERTVRAVKPDFKRLATVDCRGVIVTARSDDARFDFVSRFFAPASGVDEDPVTGSAHCCLAEFWGKRLGKKIMKGFQASTRGGVVEVELRGTRVILRGDAVIVARGDLFLDRATGTSPPSAGEE